MDKSKLKEEIIKAVLKEIFISRSFSFIKLKSCYYLIYEYHDIPENNVMLEALGCLSFKNMSRELRDWCIKQSFNSFETSEISIAISDVLNEAEFMLFLEHANDY